ncbi:MAG TPA: sortase [Anaerolineales bacterium]|nr:sortase [Anaerolineales bacterium]
MTATIPGNLINTLPSDALTSMGAGGVITNTSPASATLNVTGTSTPPPTPPPPSLPPVTLNKNFSPGTIWAEGISQLTIVIRNNQTSASLTQASVTDNLPANVFLANPVSPSLTGCGASASVTAVSGGTSVTLNNGTIAPGSTCTVRVNVTSNVQGTYTNRIPANSLRTRENLSNPSDATDRLTVQAIGIAKVFSPGIISAGGTATLTITLQNPTGSDYTGARFTDNLPSPMTVAPNPSISNTCGGTLSTTPSNTISLTGGVIPAGSPTVPGTCTISVQVTVPVGAVSGTLTNTIPRDGLGTDQGVGNPRPATDRVTVRGTDVTASKSFSNNSITVGENSRLRIDYIAPSDTNLTGFSIIDNLPSGITISNSTPPSMSGCGDAAILTANTGEATISLTNGLILAGQRCRINVFVTGSETGTYTNTIPLANITNNENRLPPGDLTADLSITNPAPGNLAMALVKGFDPLTVFGGASSTMSVLLINPGNVALTGIAFTDTMPSGMILANPLNFNVGSCGGTLSGVSGTSSFSFSGGSLPAGSRCTLTLSVTMTINGNLTNIIPENAVTTLEGASNPDPAEASLTNLPGASVSKYFSSNPITAGSYSLLTITIQNTGNVALSGMGLKDTLPGTLPAGLMIANPPAPAPTNTCGGDLTAVAGTQIIQLTNGSLVASAACSIVVSVISSTPGSYQNTIPAGTLISDQGATNHNVATDTLVVTVNSVARRRGGSGGGNNSTPDVSAASTFPIPVTGFAPGRVTGLDISSHPVYDATSLTLEIPVLKVKTPIMGVDFKDGKWDISWLQDQIGWLNGTAYPTWEGNSVLTAHVTNADGKPGVFSQLKALGVGEYVFVYHSGYRYTYKVVSNVFVQPNDASVMKHEEKSFLTLITCDSYDEKTGTYLRRVAVRAVLVDVSE